MKHNTDTLREAMRNRWRDYFYSTGVELPPTNNRHGSCANCGGTDRFRFDDKEGSGSYICSQCGAGDGFSLMMKVFKYTFPQALEAIASYLGTPNIDYVVTHHPRPKKPAEPLFYDTAKRYKINQVISQSESTGQPLVNYFEQRGLKNLSEKTPKSIRFHSGLPYWSQTDKGEWIKEGIYPAMLGRVTDLSGELITVHRTYITNEGNKAPHPSVKKLMPAAVAGSLKGCSIKLGTPTDTLYLTEGIETGLAVMLSTGGIVWACISAKLLEQVLIPESVTTVYIMADKDRTNAGEQSANKLAQRLLKERKGITVKICLPPLEISTGKKSIDWLDAYNLKQLEVM